ncbi:MAG: YcbK family protein, partial [Alphaproteobacteria bacterium]
MRDWRENTEVEIDPRLVDLLWEMHTELESKEPIHIICGYRSAKTNNMLRRTRGGQAKRSFHISGKAIDASFPDVPVKRMRYSALVRERGGVGYYPTSGIPFVHVDVGRVRAWPRVPRYELALLFPNGKTKHRPTKGGPITRKDVQIARSRYKKLATQVAAFHEDRHQPKTPMMMAEAATPALKIPTPKPASPPEVQVASLSPIAQAPAAIPAPQITRTPRLVAPPKRAVPPPSEAERKRLNELVTRASLTPSDRTYQRPPAADRRRLDELISYASLGHRAPQSPRSVTRGFTTANTSLGLGSRFQEPAKQSKRDARTMTRMAAFNPAPAANTPTNMADIDAANWSGGWAPAPAFDEDHPEELSYRPFPLAPLLTQSASIDDDALGGLVHPDVARTLDLLNEDQIVLPLRLRPGRQAAEFMWAQQFQGKAVNLTALELAEPPRPVPAGLTSRSVRTSWR